MIEPQGIYDPRKRFAFTNIGKEDFNSAWNGSPIRIPAGETHEVPHHLAVKFTKELVDSIMIGNAKMDEVAMLERNPNVPLPRSPRGSSLGVPAARKEYEDQICRELEVNEESPEIQILRSKIKEELLADMNGKPSTEPQVGPSSVEEFADVRNVKEEAPKNPLKTKKIK